MQTQSPQSLPFLQANTPQPAARNTPPAPNGDFQKALSRQLERAPASTAQDAAPQDTAQNAPAKTRPVQQPKTAQQAQQTRQANQAADAQQAATPEAAAQQDAAAPAGAQAAQPGKSLPADEAAERAASEEAIAAAAADPMASMLAMLAAYHQLTPAAATVAADAALAAPATTEDGADETATGLPALQADVAGKRALPDVAVPVDGRSARQQGADTGAAQTDDTSALQGLQAKAADADGVATLAQDAKGVDPKAEAFAAKLAVQQARQQATQTDAAPAQPALPPGAAVLAATAQAAQAVASSQLQARVGSSAWEQQLGQKVVWMVAGGDQSASLTLNPPDLGPLQVVLSVSNDSATATFTAHQPETRQAIENALPKLREMMSEAGIDLGEASVSAGTQDQQQAFAEQARASEQRGNGRQGGRYGDGQDDGQPDTPQPVVRRTVLGAVDTFA